MLAQGYAKIGQTDKARNLLSQLERLSSHRYVGHVSFALVHHRTESDHGLPG
jgi:hypothetical protein